MVEQAELGPIRDAKEAKTTNIATSIPVKNDMPSTEMQSAMKEVMQNLKKTEDKAADEERWAFIIKCNS